MNRNDELRMMKRMLFESESANAVRVRNVTAALLLALSTGCASRGGREAGAASASRAVAVTTDTSASAGADAAGARRVRVSAEGVKAAEPSTAAAADGSVYVAWVGHGAGKEADVWLTRFDGAGKQAGEAARVNPEVGAATAWRGDPP